MSGKPLAFFIGGLMFALISIPFLKQKDLKNDAEKISFSYKRFLKRVISEKKIFSLKTKLLGATFPRMADGYNEKCQTACLWEFFNYLISSVER